MSADALERLTVLREALKPFAALADALVESLPDNLSMGFFADGAMRFGPGCPTLGDCRRASATLHAADHDTPAPSGARGED